MRNEFFIILSLLFSFFAVVFSNRIFGKNGLYVWISLSAILANIEVCILVKAFGIEQTLGNILFASSFLATDILSECYGKNEAKKGVYLGVFTSIIFLFFSNLWIYYLPSENDWAFSSIKTLFSKTPRILIGSLISYIISEAIDVFLYHHFWKMTEKKTGSKEKFLWFRNNLATLLSQAVNIIIFNFVAFYGIYSIGTLISITLSCYVIYIFTSLFDTPFLYFAKHISKK